MLPWKRVLRPLAALLLATAAATVPASAAHASTTAASPSSGWNDYSCKPSAAHPRPVVLVHGTLGNSVDNWLSLAPYLKDRGYCVYSLDYGQLSGVPLFYGLAANLAVPLILHWVRRRWVLTIGACAQITSALLFTLGTQTTLLAGLALQVVAMAMLDVVINLYLLDHIPRRGLNHFEPRRLLFAGSAFAAGPWVGVYLHRNVAENSTYLVAALATATLLIYFWTLRLADNPSLQAGVAPPPNPLRFVPRFAAQPRLVLSWALALGRNGWWVMNFIYTPIYVTNAGYPATVRSP